MPNTYTQIHIHAVFPVQDRDCIIKDHWKDELYKYITGVLKNHSHKPLAIINSMPDHVHVLFGMRPTQSLSDLLQDIKGDSSMWINKRRFIRSRFSWQEGYGAFSYSKSQLPQVIRYIERQQEHYKKTTFLEEYREFLDAFGVEYDEKYLFTPIDY